MEFYTSFMRNNWGLDHATFISKVVKSIWVFEFFFFYFQESWTIRFLVHIQCCCYGFPSNIAQQISWDIECKQKLKRELNHEAINMSAENGDGGRWQRAKKGSKSELEKLTTRNHSTKRTSTEKRKFRASHYVWVCLAEIFHRNIVTIEIKINELELSIQCEFTIDSFQNDFQFCNQIQSDSNMRYM